jgi:hypothetical protein
LTARHDQVRTYPGRTQAEAGERLAEDEGAMTAAGYAPASQSWAEKIEYGTASKIWLATGALCTAGGWLIAPPLSLIAMVFLAIGVMTRTRTGELTVTWTALRLGSRAASSGPMAPSPGAGPETADAIETAPTVRVHPPE